MSKVHPNIRSSYTHYLEDIEVNIMFPQTHPYKMCPEVQEPRSLNTKIYTIMHVHNDNIYLNSAPYIYTIYRKYTLAIRTCYIYWSVSYGINENEWMDGRTEGRTDGRTDERTNERMKKPIDAMCSD